MKQLRIFLGGTMFLTLVLSAFSFRPPSGPSANGQGSLSLPNEVSRRFSFHANTMPDGTVKGSGVLTYTGGELKIMFDIDCLNVVGNTATMSGVVTRVEGTSAFQEGYRCRFKVTDNGEGANAAPDEMTLLQGSTSLPDCNAPFNLQENPIEGGNIQVKQR